MAQLAIIGPCLYCMIIALFGCWVAYLVKDRNLLWGNGASQVWVYTLSIWFLQGIITISFFAGNVRAGAFIYGSISLVWGVFALFINDYDIDVKKSDTWKVGVTLWVLAMIPLLWSIVATLHDCIKCISKPAGQHPVPTADVESAAPASSEQVVAVVDDSSAPPSKV